jgi:phenylpropionate dioxygenase-like ring-hydroxylating dioxygenase large terminal subunit
MIHREQVRLIKELLAHIDTGTTVDAGGFRRNPATVYSDPALADREWAELFRGHPQLIGLSGELAGPGAFVTVDDLGVPILATRDDDGEFHAFVNACRHRGAVVETRERGQARSFRCPFHAWTYSTRGDLTGIPKPDHFGDVCRDALGLVELPACERYGMLWVHPDVHGRIDPDALLGADLAAELASWRLDELVYLDRDGYDVACNWKLAMDTFGETYHFPFLHRDTINLAFHGNVQAYDTFGRNHRMLLVRRGIDDMRGRPEDQWSITEATLPAYWLFPNVQLLPFTEGVYLVRVYPVPGEPGRHRTHITFYLRPDVTRPADLGPDENQRTLAQLFASIIRDEDYVMSASQQLTASAAALDSSLFGRNEPALHHYHSTYREALGMPTLPLLPDATDAR